MIFFNYFDSTAGYNTKVILIGSSVFSDNAYEDREHEYYRDCVLSESIAMNSTATDYLNGIFVEFIMNAL